MLDIVMLLPNNKKQGNKEHVISFIAFAFIEVVTVIDWIKSMKLYLCDIEESYKDTIIVHLGNAGTADLLLGILQCWCTCTVNVENSDLPMVLYFSQMMNKYYSHLGFSPIKHNEEGKDIHNEIFNNIPHFIKNRMHVDFLQYRFVLYKN